MLPLFTKIEHIYTIFYSVYYSSSTTLDSAQKRASSLGSRAEICLSHASPESELRRTLYVPRRTLKSNVQTVIGLAEDGLVV